MAKALGKSMCFGISRIDSKVLVEISKQYDAQESPKILSVPLECYTK